MTSRVSLSGVAIHEVLTQILDYLADDLFDDYSCTSIYKKIRENIVRACLFSRFAFPPFAAEKIKFGKAL